MTTSSGDLVMIRHAQSEWNKSHQFTGWMDVQLSDEGVEEARHVGEKLKAAGYRFDLAFTSHLVRTWQTLILIQEAMGSVEGPVELPTISSERLNECKYGELTGINKDEARHIWGEELVHQWRRSYDIAPPGGESLKDVEARLLPYFERHILPRVIMGQNILMVAHSNTLRSLLRIFDNVDTDATEVLDLEIPNGEILIYRFNDDGSVAHKSKLPDEVTETQLT